MTVPMYLAETASPVPARHTYCCQQPLHHRCHAAFLRPSSHIYTGGQMVAGLVDGAFSNVPNGWRCDRTITCNCQMILNRAGSCWVWRRCRQCCSVWDFCSCPSRPATWCPRAAWTRFGAMTSLLRSNRQARAVLVRVRGTDNVDRELSAIQVHAFQLHTH